MTGNDNQSRLVALRGLSESLDAHRRKQFDDDSSRPSLADATWPLRAGAVAAEGGVAAPASHRADRGGNCRDHRYRFWFVVVAAVLRTHRPRHRDAVDHRRHRAEFRLASQGRDRRHAFSSVTRQGRTAVRIRDIVVREPDGRIIASAPRAEVGLSHASLFSGSPARRKSQSRRRRDLGAHRRRRAVHAAERRAAAAAAATPRRRCRRTSTAVV